MDHASYVLKKPKVKRETHNCCVPQCPELRNRSIRMHAIPTDPVRRKKWAIAIRTAKELSRHMRVCSKHFLKVDYIPSTSLMSALKKTAVPSQNLPVRSHEKAETSPVKRQKTARADRRKKRAVWACEDHSNDLGPGMEKMKSLDSTDGQSTTAHEDEANSGSMDDPEVDEDDVDKFKYTESCGETIEIGPVQVSHQQREEMINFMLGHPDMASNKIVGPQAPVIKQRLWSELADILNSCAIGATKSPEKWAKEWMGWRINTKKKANQIRDYVQGSGAPYPKAVLTPQEEKLLALLEEEPVEGIAEVPDPLQYVRGQRVGNTEPSSDPNPFQIVFGMSRPSTSSPQTSSLPPATIASPQSSQPSSSTCNHLPIKEENVEDTPPSLPHESTSTKSPNSAQRGEGHYRERMARAYEKQAAALTSIARTVEETAAICRDTLLEFAEFLRRH